MKITTLLISIFSLLLISCSPVKRATKNDACTHQVQYKMSIVTIENQLKTEKKEKQIEFLKEQLAYNQGQYNRTLKTCPKAFSNDKKWTTETEKMESNNKSNTLDHPFN
ncbi:hypothetical protein OAA91_00700 [Fibrobacterales bacterium]|nr:hypothetical protein [Fibrobacterales bacterium]